MREIDLQIDDFMIECSAKGLSKKTIGSYESTLRLLANYLEKELEVERAEEVTQIHLKSYIRYLQERGKYTVVVNDNSKTSNNPEGRGDYKEGMSNITINNYIRNIKVFFNYMYNENLIRVNPVKNLKKLKASRKPKYYITDEQLIRLLNNFSEALYHEYRDKVIVGLLLDTRNEITAKLF